MKIIIASSNSHKIQEIQSILTDFKIIPYTHYIPAFEIKENAHSFKGNATIKAKAVYEALKAHANIQDSDMVLADDSGICIEALGGKPGICSARYGDIRDDASNLQKVIDELKALSLTHSKAYFCAAMVLIGKNIHYSTHGFVHGEVSIYPKGNNGFGYDPIFKPYNKTQTLAQMSNEEKNSLSHRFNALKLMKIVIQAIQ